MELAKAIHCSNDNSSARALAAMFKRHEHFAQAVVAAAVRRPAHDVKQLPGREVDDRLGEIVRVLGDVEQGQHDVLVGGRRQAVPRRRLQGAEKKRLQKQCANILRDGAVARATSTLRNHG